MTLISRIPARRGRAAILMAHDRTLVSEDVGPLGQEPSWSDELNRGTIFEAIGNTT
jgi:hypothetical protein